MRISVNAPFGEWLPDQPAFNNPGVTIATNVVPDVSGYQQLQRLVAVTSALNTRCLGAFSARDNAAASYNFFGTATKLYLQDELTMTDVTRLASAYATATDEFWEFVLWGEKIISTNYTNEPQIITMGGANFADLAGTPPKARHLTVVGQFVVMGNLNEGGAVDTRKIRWSGINNETQWTASAATQSDAQIIYSAAPHGGGWIQRLVGRGNFGLILQEYAIQRMDYKGSPEIFQFEDMLPGIGTPSPNSVINSADVVYFLAQDGFYGIINGTTPVPIGQNKIDRTFFNEVSSNGLLYVVGAEDPVNKKIMWIYSTTGSSPDRALIFDYVNERWSKAEFSSEWIYSGLGTGYTTDGATFGALFTDDYTTSVDSREYTGGALQLNAVDTAHKKATFSGTALDATIETQEVQAFPGGEESKNSKAYVSGVRPLVDASSVTLTAQVGSRNKLDSAYTYGVASSPHADTNICPSRNVGRYHRVRVTTSGNFEHAQGCDVYASRVGER